MEKQRKAPANDKAKTETGRKQKVKEMNMPEMSGRRKRKASERRTNRRSKEDGRITVREAKKKCCENRVKVNLKNFFGPL